MKAPLYLSYTAGYPQPFEDFVKFVHSEGFVGLEFIPDLSPNLPEELDRNRIQTLLQLKSEFSLEYTVHNIYMDINLTSLVPRVRQLAFDLTVDVMRFAKAINAQAVIVHNGYRFGPWRTKVEQSEMFEKVQQETYNLLSRYSTAFNVPVLLENGNYYLLGRNGIRQPLHIGIEADELLMLASLPQAHSFGICFDIGKAYQSARNYSKYEVMEYIKRITPLLREIHLSKFEGYQAVAPDVLSYLDEICFDGPIVFECSQGEIDLLRSLFPK